MPQLSTLVLATERACETVKPNGRRAEFRIRGVRNLILRVSPAGNKSFTYLYKSPRTGKWRRVSLGVFPTTSLDSAKTSAVRHLAAVNAGLDPLALQPTSDLTFGEMAKAYIAEHRQRYAPAWTKEVERMLEADVMPHLKTLRVDSVLRAEVASVVEKVATRGAFDAADNTLGLLRAVFNWGAATGRTEHDPTRGLRKRNTGRPRERVLSDDEIRAAWRYPTEFRLAFQLQLCLAMRIGEVVGAAKGEIDLAQRMWVVPASRTKSRREHRLPLPPLAVSILDDAMGASGGSVWLFPSAADGMPLRTRSAAQALQRLSKPRPKSERFTPHDLRRTCSTRMADLGVADEVIERILNHAPPTTSRRHYNHSLRVDEMRGALETWGAHVSRLVGAL